MGQQEAAGKRMDTQRKIDERRRKLEIKVE
jgi:hypothetical protein